MKKVILMMSIAVFALTSCGKDEVDPQPNPTPQATIVGTWDGKLLAGFEYNQTQMDTVSSIEVPLNGSLLQIEFKADGTMISRGFGDSTTGTYVFSNNKLTTTVDGEVEIAEVKSLTTTEMVIVTNEIYTEDGDTYLDQTTVTLVKK